MGDKTDLLNKYRTDFADIVENNIKLIKLGFIDKIDNYDIMFPIMIHCIENIDIFNEVQLNNINLIINKLNYGQ